MGLSYQTKNYANTFNSVYNVTLDMSGWDRTTIEAVGPVLGTLNLQATNDGGGTNYASSNAQLAINFSPIQAKNLATGTMVNAIYGAGLFEVPIDAQYLRVQGAPAGSPTSIYRLIFNHSKTG